ncbi:MAG TPA: DUF1761 domain-containing protein [Candidatus Nanoarchaeia archaeon]|nr:DUF1761 domain-containing protein [Candidatus Nanoarchaeia archaeon]
MAVELNMFAVFVSAVVSMTIGSLWYGPLFGKEWMKLEGAKKNKGAKKENMVQSYAIGFVSYLLMSYILGYFVDYSGAITFAEGAILGVWIWAGFFATSMLGMVLWEGKPIKLYMIKTLYFLVVLSLMAGIQAAWV